MEQWFMNEDIYAKWPKLASADAVHFELIKKNKNEYVENMYFTKNGVSIVHDNKFEDITNLKFAITKEYSKKMFIHEMKCSYFMRSKDMLKMTVFSDKKYNNLIYLPEDIYQTLVYSKKLYMIELMLYNFFHPVDGDNVIRDKITDFLIELIHVPDYHYCPKIYRND
jgi:hypothetical protein